VPCSALDFFYVRFKAISSVNIGAKADASDTITLLALALFGSGLSGGILGFIKPAEIVCFAVGILERPYHWLI
jgi:hypothetical protein